MENNVYLQQYVEEVMKKARAAQAIFAEATQEQLNKAARTVARTVYDNAEIFAEEAVAETGMGTVEGKILKQKGAMTSQWCYTKDKISTGVVGWEQGKLDVDCILKIAKPVGVVAAVMPVTNPTTCFGHNAMVSLKSGNAIIICPHPRAKHVSLHCTRLMRENLEKEGFPADLVQCVEEPSIEATNAFMHAADVILATGGPGMVVAANSSGNPSLGVGQGNVQMVIDKGMNRIFDELAVAAITNRAWDSGIPCTGEQTIIMPECDKDELVAAFERNGAVEVHDPVAIDKLRKMLFNEKDGKLTPNPVWVGQTAQDIGKAIGVEVPEGKKTLLVHIEKYGWDEPLCKEKMCPVSNYITYSGEWADGVKIAKANLMREGAGHSSVIYTDSEENQRYAGLQLPVCRLIVNSGEAVVGGEPYYTNGMIATAGVGCGYWQKNVLSENLTFAHLLNYTRLFYTVPGKPTPTEEEIWSEA